MVNIEEGPEGTMGVLLQMVSQNDQKHDDAHKRLRVSFRELEDRIESNFEYLRDGFMANRARMDALEKQAGMPVDVTKLVLTPRVVVAIVVASLTLAGGIWASTAGLRSDVRDILTRMEAQTATYESVAKLQEVQSNALKTAVDDMKRRQELQQYEIQQLKEVILGRK